MICPPIVGFVLCCECYQPRNIVEGETRNSAIHNFFQGMGTHLALFFVVMRGNYDPLLEWPFPHNITLYLLDHRDQEKLSVKDDICPSQVLEENADCFNKPNPKEERNVGYGNSTFASHLVIDSGAFVRDDVIFVKCVVHTT